MASGRGRSRGLCGSAFTPLVIDTEGEAGRGEIGIDASVFLVRAEITVSGWIT